MKLLVQAFFSMKTTAVLLLVFAFAIGVATFIENDYGTTAAKALVYGARWFELLLIILGANLLGNIFIFKMYRREKLPMLFFHVSFLVILAGAGITRFAGFEGIMHIREGSSTDRIVSRENYIAIEVEHAGKKYRFQKQAFLTPVKKYGETDSLYVGEKTLDVTLEQFVPNAAPVIEPVNDGKPLVSFVAAIQEAGVRRAMVLEEGTTESFEGRVIGFNTLAENPASIQITRKDGQLMIQAPAELEKYDMATQQASKLDSNQAHLLEPKKLYKIGDVLIVMQEFRQSAKVVYKPQDIKSTANGDLDLLEFTLNDGKTEKSLRVFGKEGVEGKNYTSELGDMKVAIKYGPKNIQLPFAIKLRDFQLERYPGSMSPASYASEVTVLDTTKNQRFDFRIFMNHILAYEGYRFYQSSYDRDEKGTILSVNHDYWGTVVTYIGYILLAIGMFASLFSPKGRMRELSYKLGKLRSKTMASVLIAATAFLAMPNTLQAQTDMTMEEVLKQVQSVEYEHARNFGSLLAQDRGGRIKPVDTLAQEVVTKVAKTSALFDLHPTQVFLGMVVRPNVWQKVKMIKVSHPELKKIIGLDKSEKHAAFSDFFDLNRPEAYKLGALVDQASRKRPAEQDKLDKELIKVDERVNICYMVFAGELLRILPKPHDAHSTWFSPIAAIEQFPKEESEKAKELVTNYLGSVDSAMTDKSWRKADDALIEVEKYQKFYGVSVYPPEMQTKIEILYNDLQIFKKLFPLYGLVGLILLFAAIFHVIKPVFNLTRAYKVAWGILFVGFLVHTFGLGLRWYISGHAPWSNGYESMIYIGWATLLAGFLFARNNAIVLAATGILASTILFTAHLSWMDPQITNLVPVLNSYWLVIHVSMITASYGFLGLGAIIGFIVLLMMIMRKTDNHKKIDVATKELTYINEMSLILGLVLLTIGNFLGGVWANESWGRYWGWDPKETWALVTILVYAFVVHMRFIPALKGVLSFNIASVVGFSSVLMTYFGVNFYLSGLHSYAKGDPVPIPTWVYVTIVVVLITILLAWRNNHVSQKH